MSDEARSTEERSAYGSVEPAVKLAFLRRPTSYPEGTPAVEVKETHMSWVFLTARHAYKLKKPVRYDFLDFSTVALRRHFCNEELRLNRRLAPDVYLGVVPLTVTPQGSLALGGSGVPVDWLVKMRRLPESGMLDHVIQAGRLRPADLGPVADLLAGFYAAAPHVPISGADYRQIFRQGVESNRGELLRYCPPGMAALIARVCDAQARHVEARAADFDRRAEGGSIVEGHGDLRPEHVFLGPPPQIIDCLEFELAYRQVDIADDLASLAVECDRLGAFEVGPALFRIAPARAAPPSLIAFYKSYRAALRAKLAIWHLKDHDVHDPARWRDRALDYLVLADRLNAEMRAG